MSKLLQQLLYMLYTVNKTKTTVGHSAIDSCVLDDAMSYFSVSVHKKEDHAV